MSKINSKQARPATKMKVFFENSLDFLVFYARLKIAKQTIRSPSRSRDLGNLYVALRLIFLCLDLSNHKKQIVFNNFLAFRENSNGSCRLDGVFAPNLKAFLLPTKGDLIMSKINSKQTHTAAEMKVFFENSLDFLVFYARLKIAKQKIRSPSRSRDLGNLYVALRLIFLCLDLSNHKKQIVFNNFLAFRENSNGCCRLDGVSAPNLKAFLLPTKGDLIMSKINSKQARPATAAEMKVFFENSLDFSIFHAKLNTIVSTSTINKVYRDTILVVKQTIFFIQNDLLLLREVSNEWCRLTRSLVAPTAKAFLFSGKEI